MKIKLEDINYFRKDIFGNNRGRSLFFILRVENGSEIVNGPIYYVIVVDCLWDELVAYLLLFICLVQVELIDVLVYITNFL